MSPWLNFMEKLFLLLKNHGGKLSGNVNDLVTVYGITRKQSKKFLYWPWKKNNSLERLCNDFYVAYYGHIMVKSLSLLK